jgi:hypothetical protein
MSKVEKVVIQNFRYPAVTRFRRHDNMQMRQLNYITSRIRAALCQWAIGIDTEEPALWWWRGLQNELVTCQKLLVVTLASLKVGGRNGTCRSHRGLNEYLP